MAEETDRYFQILVADAKFAKGPMKGKRIENIGRYESKTPLSAAKKAAGRIFRDAGVSSVTFIIRETTSGSSKFSFVYLAEKRKLKEPKTITRRKKLDDGTFEEGSDVVLTITHQNHVEAILGESEKRAVYKKLDIPFPSDTASIDNKAKKNSKKSSGKARTRRGGGIADTAYPVTSGSTSALGMDSHYTIDGSEYKPDTSQTVKPMKGGSSQCCQTSPANFDSKILGGNEAIVASSVQNGADQVQSAMNDATAASRERFLNSL